MTHYVASILIGTNLNSKEMNCPRCSHATLSADFRLDSMERPGWLVGLMIYSWSMRVFPPPFPLKSYPATQKKSSPSPVAEVRNAMWLLTNRNRIHACCLNIECLSPKTAWAKFENLVCAEVLEEKQYHDICTHTNSLSHFTSFSSQNNVIIIY